MSRVPSPAQTAPANVKYATEAFTEQYERPVIETKRYNDEIGNGDAMQLKLGASIAKNKIIIGERQPVCLASFHAEHYCTGDLDITTCNSVVIQVCTVNGDTSSPRR